MDGSSPPSKGRRWRLKPGTRRTALPIAARSLRFSRIRSLAPRPERNTRSNFRSPFHPITSSAKNPDPNINWPAYYPINGFDAYFPTNKNPYSENYFVSLERQFGQEHGVRRKLHWQPGDITSWSCLRPIPGTPHLCLSLSQPSDVMPGTPTCGPFGENLVYTRSNGQIVNGTRAPFGNDFGTDVYFDAMGNSAYNSLQVSLKHSGGGLTVTGQLYLRKIA